MYGRNVMEASCIYLIDLIFVEMIHPISVSLQLGRWMDGRWMVGNMTESPLNYMFGTIAKLDTAAVCSQTLLI